MRQQDIEEALLSRFTHIRETKGSDVFLDAVMAHLVTVSGWIVSDHGADAAVNALKFVQRVVAKQKHAPRRRVRRRN
jgi:hypothetical protein